MGITIKKNPKDEVLEAIAQGNRAKLENVLMRFRNKRKYSNYEQLVKEAARTVLEG